MRVKEKDSPDFKFGEMTQKILKEEGDLMLIEQVRREDDLPYSKYLIYDMKYNVSYVQMFVPDPRKKNLYKDFYLKYQVGTRIFLLDFFEILTGKEIGIEVFSKYKQKKDIVYEINEDNGAVLLKLSDGYLFGIIDFDDKEKNKKFAENFINYFSGNTLDYSWEEICEQ